MKNGGATRPSQALRLAASAGVLLVLLPIAGSVWGAVPAGVGGAFALLWRPIVGALLFNTARLVLAVGVGSAVLGTLSAILVERWEFPGRRLFATLAAVPLAIPAFITSYAWVSIGSGLQDFAGAVLVVTFSYYPLVYLPVAAALRGLDPALEESARALGLGPVAVFVRVVLPQLRAALLGGVLIVALDTLVEFGAFQLLRYRTFTTELYAEYRTGDDGPDASVLALVLLALCLVLLALELRVRGRGRLYARVGRGTRRPARRRASALRATVAVLFFTGLAAGTLGVPLGTILYWLTRHDAAAFSAAGATAGALFAATTSSLGLALAGAAATVALALPLGFLASRDEGRFATMLERGAYLGQGMPGIVVALSLTTLTLAFAPVLYESAALLIAAYAIVFLPLALVAIRSAFVQAERAHEDAARALGLAWHATALRVVLPIAGAGIGAAGSMVFTSVVTELTATLLLAPVGTTTLATEVWADTSTLAFAAAAPYAAVMAVLSLASTALLARRFGQVAA